MIIIGHKSKEGSKPLTERQNGEQAERREQTNRQERAERILDAAATLIQRWGYAKTTLDDIARQAHVSKGTIYQYWKTREDLLMALISRERLKVGEDIRQRLEADPAGATLRGFIKNSMLALLKNPLIRAVMTRNTDTLGKLASQVYSDAMFAESMETYTQFLELSRAQGIIGTDLDLQEQSYILGAVWIGFLMANAWLPETFHFSDETIADLLAETIQRALAPRSVDSNRANESTRATLFNQYMEKELHTMREHYKEQNS
jgi:AcrR family transcriptional regulator